MFALNTTLFLMTLAGIYLVLGISAIIAALSLMRLQRLRQTYPVVNQRQAADYSDAISLLSPSVSVSASVRRPHSSRKRATQEMKAIALNAANPPKAILQLPTPPPKASPSSSANGSSQKSKVQGLVDYLKSELADTAV